VPDSKAAAFVRDAQIAARAIKLSVPVDRMNYAVLGNVEPHVHMHLIPRVAKGDPSFMRPPWERRDRPRPLAPDERRSIVSSLQAALGAIATDF